MKRVFKDENGIEKYGVKVELGQSIVILTNADYIKDLGIWNKSEGANTHFTVHFHYKDSMYTEEFTDFDLADTKLNKIRRELARLEEHYICYECLKNTKPNYTPPATKRKGE